MIKLNARSQSPHHRPVCISLRVKLETLTVPLNGEPDLSYHTLTFRKELKKKKEEEEDV